MKLSISNIAWDSNNDESIYEMMMSFGFVGLEIAPTRIIPINPYENTEEAYEWSSKLKRERGFNISSMQSIWYGKSEKLFGDDDERDFLLKYTFKAIDFASKINCGNLVFGCPKNRYMPDGADIGDAIDFFNKAGNYAAQKDTVIGLEANPTIYGTNFINDTRSALEMIERVESIGFKLNLDIGTMIQNSENISVIKGKVDRISHVHISEPMLKPIEKRKIHRELFEVLCEEGYNGYVSIEMGKTDNIALFAEKLEYIRSIFK